MCILVYTPLTWDLGEIEKSLLEKCLFILCSSQLLASKVQLLKWGCNFQADKSIWRTRAER